MGSTVSEIETAKAHIANLEFEIDGLRALTDECPHCHGDGDEPHTDNDVTGPMPCSRCGGLKRVARVSSGVEPSPSGPPDGEDDEQFEEAVEDEAFNYREWAPHLSWDRDRSAIFDEARKRVSRARGERAQDRAMKALQEWDASASRDGRSKEERAVEAAAQLVRDNAWHTLNAHAETVTPTDLARQIVEAALPFLSASRDGRSKEEPVDEHDLANAQAFEYQSGYRQAVEDCIDALGERL